MIPIDTRIGDNKRTCDTSWWEDTDIVERECLFWVTKNGFVLSSVICEDLARIDPVQQALRAVGPNLIIAILMDGPQYSHRWSGRYATALSDDPGSSVLTLTSLGMTRRATDLGQSEDRRVGMWRDALGSTKELILPPKAAAIALCLNEHQVVEYTADGREQEIELFEVSKKLTLSNARPVFPRQGGSQKFFYSL